MRKAAPYVAIIAGTGVLFLAMKANAYQIPPVDFAAYPNDGDVYADAVQNAVPATVSNYGNSQYSNATSYDPNTYYDEWGYPIYSDATSYDPNTYYNEYGYPIDAGGDDILSAPQIDGYFINVAYSPQITPIGNAMRTSMQGITAISDHEGFRDRPYKDVAGFWTIGYGHKLKSGEWWDRITPEFARELLVQDVGIAEDAVNAYVTVPLSQPQFDALVSLAYNIGVGAFKRSTLLQKLNAGDYDGALAQFALWRRAGGQVVQGLVNRRAAEAQMFASGTQGSVA